LDRTAHIFYKIYETNFNVGLIKRVCIILIAIKRTRRKRKFTTIINRVSKLYQISGWVSSVTNQFPRKYFFLHKSLNFSNRMMSIAREIIANRVSELNFIYFKALWKSHTLTRMTVNILSNFKSAFKNDNSEGFKTLVRRSISLASSGFLYYA
jgi:hypothetical protein